MKNFRINLFLRFKDFLASLVKILFLRTDQKKIDDILKKNSRKKHSVLISQCRVGLILILNFFKKKKPNKNEIIFSSYNLPAMINVAKQLKFKIIFSQIKITDGSFDLKRLEKKINKNTLAVVLTNMFNSQKESIQLKKLCNKKKILLIEDNAIYFDNYYKRGRKMIFTGSFGDFTIYSFNIMKNISALYGGAICFNSDEFSYFCKKKIDSYATFPIILIFKQICIYLILKIVSLKYIYNYIFFIFLKFAHINNNKTLMTLFYPSLRFKISSLPRYYFSKINKISKELIYKQLINYKIRNKNHHLRKKKNLYYIKKLKDFNVSQVKSFKINDINFQNFIDFPIMVERKKQLIRYLLNKGIELKTIHYQDCSKIFKIKPSCRTTQIFEKKIVCLPNHRKISYSYINKVILNIKNFYLIN